MKTIIYADNAATTKLDSTVFDAMKTYLVDVYANASQPYSYARSSKLAIIEARKTIAKAINADEDEIFFTSGGSESDNWAIKCYGSNTVKKHVIVSKIEHHAVLNSCKSMMVNNAALIDYLPVDSTGIVNRDKLVSLLKKNNNNELETLVSVMFANNEIGTIEPIKELVEIAHSHNALFHTDAVQAIGHVKIDVKELGIDFLSASAHKFNGPRGIGFLYIKKGINIRPLIDGGSQEFGLRAGTENTAAIIGMAKAIDVNSQQLDANQNKLKLIEQRFIDGLISNNIDFIRNGAINHLPGLINISLKGINGETLLHRLDLLGCCVSTGSACDGVKNQLSHVIKAIKVDKEYAKGTIRVSFGKNNTLTDASELSIMIKKVLLDS